MFYLSLSLFQEFAATDPLLSEFKSEILRYQALEQEIDNISPTFRVGHGAIELYSGIKSSLSSSALPWSLLSYALTFVCIFQ